MDPVALTIKQVDIRRGAIHRQRRQGCGRRPRHGPTVVNAVSWADGEARKTVECVGGGHRKKQVRVGVGKRGERALP